MIRKYFFDTEFIEDGRTIDLVSIGMVSEDGRSLYLGNMDADFAKASDWVRENVFPHLPLREDLSCKYIPCFWKSRTDIRNAVLDFCNPHEHGNPEFWGYFADYDWIVLCQLFGRMIDLPQGWPMYCGDVKQLADSVQAPKLPEPENAHNALTDARWNRDYYNDIKQRIESGELSMLSL